MASLGIKLSDGTTAEWIDEMYIQTTQTTPHDYCPHGSPEQVRVDQEDGIWYWFVDVEEDN